MPTADEHLMKYNVNKRLLNTDEMNLEKNSKHFEWIITVAFYSALHLVEREIYSNKSIFENDTSSHKERSQIISRYDRFRKIRVIYKSLADSCWKARYEAGRMERKDAETAIKNLKKIEDDLL